MFAIVLPNTTGFKRLRDRLLYSRNGQALIFETREDAERHLAMEPILGPKEIVEILTTGNAWVSA